MAAIGSGINPALGRIDYSPFLQGAQMAAQGRMQGSNALTEGISQGFQDYLKKREQNAILEGKNNALLRDIAQDPNLSGNPEIQKYTAKMAKGGGLTLNDNIKLNAELTTTVESARNRQEQQARALQMQANQFQLDAARAAKERADSDRVAMSRIWAEAGKTGKIPDQDETISLGLYYGLSPEGIASMLGVSQNSIEFGAKMAQTAAVVEKIKAENTEVAARNDRINQALRVMPNGFREYDDGKTKVFQYIDYASGQVKSEMLKAGQVPASIQQLKVKQEDMTKLVTEYQQLMASPQRDSQENIKRRELLTQQYNLILPNADVGRSNMTRTELDKMFGFQSVLTKPGTEAAKPPAPTPSNIRGVSAAAPGAQPTPAPAAAAGTQGNFNFIEDMRKRFGGGAQAAPVTTPAVDTTVATPTPAAPPPVDLNAPASINGVIPMGVAGMERGEGGEAVRLSKDERNVLQRAMSILDKTQPSGFDYGYEGRPAGNRPEPEGRLMALRAGFLPNINRAVPFASVAANAFEAMSPRAMGSSRAFAPPPAEEARAVSAAPQFLDREARATVAAMRPEMETPLPFERYQTPTQGPIPQIKLSPAAQKIASELRRSAQSGERGKAPQFFLEASTGDDGKRTRIKLSKQDLDLFLSRTPDLRGEVRMGAEFQPFSQSYGQQLRQFRAR